MTTLVRPISRFPKTTPAAPIETRKVVGCNDKIKKLQITQSRWMYRVRVCICVYLLKCLCSKYNMCVDDRRIQQIRLQQHVHVELLFLQPMFPPKPFDCSGGSAAFIFF